MTTGNLRALARPAMLSCLLGLAACGGGAGSSGSLSISFTPNRLNIAFQQWDGPYTSSFDADVEGPAPPGQVFLLITDTGTAFANGQFPTVTPKSDAVATISLQTATGLPAGSYKAALRMQLCSSQDCHGTVYGSADLPYDIEVAPNPPMGVTATPASIQQTLYTGDAGNWQLQFSLQPPAGDNGTNFWVRASDPAGVMSLNAGAPTNSGTSYVNSHFGATVTSPASLAAGEYKGALHLQFCRDQLCNQPYGGDPTLPYDLSVVSSTNLSALSPLPGAADWTTEAGNSAHNAYVPVTLDPAHFNGRWLWNANNPGLAGASLLPPVTTGGKVFVPVLGAATASNNAPLALLQALNEQDGGPAWQRQVNSGQTYTRLTTPAVAGGNVYIARSYSADGTRNNQDNHLYTFAGADGSILFDDNTVYLAPPNALLYGGTFGTAAAPTPFNGALLTKFYDGNIPQFIRYDGAGGGLVGGTPSCFADHENITTANSWSDLPLTAATDAHSAYFPHSAGLVVAHYDTQTCTEIDVTPGSPITGTSTPALAANGDLLVRSDAGILQDYDVAHATLKWSAPGPYSGSPVAAGNVVYAIDSSPARLEARSETDGSLLWSWAPGDSGETFFGNLLATDNLLFLSTSQRVLAIDTTSHQPVWTYYTPGTLALSANGILYIERAEMVAGTLQMNGTLAAVNLR